MIGWTMDYGLWTMDNGQRTEVLCFENCFPFVFLWRETFLF